MSNQIKFPSRVNVADCFVTKPQPYDFVLPGLLAGTVGLLTSPGGTGKSLLALQLSCAIGSGVDHLGFGSYQDGSVLFFAGEDPPESLHHRLYDIGNQYSQPKRDLIASRLDIRCTVGLGADLMDGSWFDWISDQAKGRRLVVIDTLSRFHSLDENSAADAKRIMMRLEKVAHETACAILVLHHVSKSSALTGQGDAQQAARGSSVFIDNARWGSFLAVMSKPEADNLKVSEAERRKFVRWNINKQNYSAPIPDTWFERGVGGVLVPADFSSVDKKVGKYVRASQTSLRGGRNACL